MHIIVLSQTLTSLRYEDCRSASQMFELGFARTSAGSGNSVTVLTRARNPYHLGSSDDLAIHGLDLDEYLTRQGATSAETSARVVVVGFGYAPPLIATMLRARRRHGCRIYTYAFDTHMGAVQSMHLAKKLVAKPYFSLGLAGLRRLSGVLVVNPMAENLLGLAHTRTLHTRIAIEPELDSSLVGPDSVSSSTNKRIVYAGALEEYNAIHQLVTAAELLSDDFSIDIYGTGSLQVLVDEVAAKMPRLQYHGAVNNPQVLAAISRADAAVALRDMRHPVSRVSFPSKMLEIMRSGTPLVGSPVLSDPEFLGQFNVVDPLTPESIASTIRAACDGEALEKAASAQQYVRDRHSWEVILPEVLRFLER